MHHTHDNVLLFVPYAVYCICVRMKVLLSAGADASLPDDDGLTPLHHAAQYVIKLWFLVFKLGPISGLIQAARPSLVILVDSFPRIA